MRTLPVLEKTSSFPSTFFQIKTAIIDVLQGKTFLFNIVRQTVYQRQLFTPEQM